MDRRPFHTPHLWVFAEKRLQDLPGGFRVSHLFSALPDSIRNDMAFHDRWHAYLPGWEIPKMQTAYFTDHLGFISDYIAEIFHEGLRNRNFADAHDRYFSFGNHLEARDRTAVVKTVSGLVKLLHPANDPTRPEMEEYVRLALEMRRRVKEQLKRMGGIEYAKVNFSYYRQGDGRGELRRLPGTGEYPTHSRYPPAAGRHLHHRL